MLDISVGLDIDNPRPEDSVTCCGVEGMNTTASRDRVETRSGEWITGLDDVVAVSSGEVLSRFRDSASTLACVEVLSGRLISAEGSSVSLVKEAGSAVVSGWTS